MDSVLVGLLLITAAALLAAIFFVVKGFHETNLSDAIYTPPTLEDLELILLRIRLEQEECT